MASAMAQWTMEKIARKRHVRTRIARRSTGREASVRPRNRANIDVSHAQRSAVPRATAVGRTSGRFRHWPASKPLEKGMKATKESARKRALNPTLKIAPDVAPGQKHESILPKRRARSAETSA